MSLQTIDSAFSGESLGQWPFQPRTMAKAVLITLAAVAGTSGLALFALPGCSGGGPDRMDRLLGICQTDADCPKGLVCQKGSCGQPKAPEPVEEGTAEGTTDGQPPSASQADEADATRKLTLRICPAYYGLPHNTGTLIAEHLESGKKHYLALPRLVPDGQVEGYFTFSDLDPGDYQITYLAGTISRGKAHHQGVKCAEEAPCKTPYRLLASVGEGAPEPRIDEHGQQRCDFDANLD